MEEENGLPTVLPWNEQKPLGLHSITCNSPDAMSSHDAQVVIDTLSIPHNSLRHIVISDGYPSIGLSLLAGGCNNIGMYFTDPTCHAFILSYLPALEFTFCELFETTANLPLQSHSGADVYWVQGGTDFVTKTLQSVVTASAEWTIQPHVLGIQSHSRQRQHQHIASVSLSHQRLGGGFIVTMGDTFFFAGAYNIPFHLSRQTSVTQGQTHPGFNHQHRNTGGRV